MAEQATAHKPSPWWLKSEAEREAEARLIAAAPEMLGYCKLMADYGDPIAVEIVAKAEGRHG